MDVRGQFGRAVVFALAAASAACVSSSSPTAELSTCAAASAYSEVRRGVSVLVLLDGEVVCERYANGAGPGDAHEIWSGTKGFSGVIAAVAARDGLLRLDEPVAETITEWRDDPARASITIRQLLNLTSGVQGGSGRAPEYAEALRVPVTGVPGARFQYGGAAFQIFGELISRKLAAAGREPDALHYLRERVLDPLGVDSSRWRRTPTGSAILPQGAVLTAPDWARFGEFIRLGGRIDGVEVVDAETFRALFEGSTANPGYGVTWWLARRNNVAGVPTAATDLGRRADEAPADLVMAGGAGDQRLYVIPSLGLTIVRQARFDPVAAAAAYRRGVDGGGAEDRWSDVDFLLVLLGEGGLD